MNKKLIGLLAMAAALVTGCFWDAIPDRKFLKDEQGRELILHGTNVLDDNTWDDNGTIDPPSMGGRRTEADFKQMAEWGFNVVRLARFWQLLEPQQGVYDESYLARTDQMVNWAHKYGLKVIIDHHQDNMNQQFNGRGIPDWAVRTDGLEYWDHGVLNISPAIRSVSPAVAAAYYHLFTDEDLNAAYEKMVVTYAERYKDHPAVIGHDIINEPWPGMLGTEVASVTGFQQRMINAIREVDTDSYILVEPLAMLANMGLPGGLDGGMTDPRTGESRLVYAPHLYDPGMDTGDTYDDANRAYLEAWRTSNVDLYAQANGMPLLVGEWGVGTDAQDFIDKNKKRYIQEMNTLMDNATAGWMSWQYEEVDGGAFDMVNRAGEGRDYLVNEQIRAYPHAVAGHITEYRFVQEAKHMVLKYENRAGVSGTTDIFVPADKMGAGWEVKSSDPAGSWSYSWDAATNMLSISHDPNQSQHTIEVVPGYRSIVNTHHGMCVDAGAVQSGGNAYMFRCHGGQNQQFRLGADGLIRNRENTNLCLDVANKLIHNGNNIIWWDCNGGNNQKWEMIDNGALRSLVWPNKCLDINEESKNLNLWDCNGTHNQKFSWRSATTDTSNDNRFVAKGTRLDGGDRVATRYLDLIMQGDGNLVLYAHMDGENRRAIWATGTQGNSGAYAVFQGDGNLVVYNASGSPRWASGTNGSGETLKLQNDRNLVIYNASGSAVWSTGTYTRNYQ